MLGGRNGLAVALIALIGVSVVVVPAYMFGSSLVDSAAEIGKNVAAGTLEIPPPNDSVKEWPMVGDKIHAAWSDAASNFSGWLQKNETQVKAIVKTVIGKIAGVGMGVLQFLVSILIAAAFLSSANNSAAAASRFFNRLAGDQGPGMLKLSVSTIRSVAVGVLGIAFIQAVLSGIGLVVVGVPAAGLWVLLILILAIAQLPPWLVLLPIIFYVFSIESTTVSIVFAIWSIVVSFSDIVLKPLLLGRGVEAPMLVILLGAIGGMITSGIIGLFVGAVVLALGYQLFQAWLGNGEAGDEDGGTEDDATSGSDNQGYQAAAE
jgi:predicted PurR-regulated permease PerM